MEHKTFFKWSKKKKRKWRLAKFPPKTKESINKRDWGRCVFCSDRAVNAHHVYYGSESNYNDNRNDIDQWVSTCLDCHLEIHGCAKWEWKRQEAINYLKNL